MTLFTDELFTTQANLDISCSENGFIIYYKYTEKELNQWKLYVVKSLVICNQWKFHAARISWTTADLRLIPKWESFLT